MTKIFRSLGVALFVFFFSATYSQAMVTMPYDGPWQTGESYINLVNYSSGSAPVSLTFYDFSEGLTDSFNLSIASFDLASVNVGYDTDGNQTLYNPANSKVLVLEDGLFGISFANAEPYRINNLAVYKGQVPKYLLTTTISDTPVPLVMTGASPVPVPAAAWLLGSGLISLIGLRRKRQ